MFSKEIAFHTSIGVVATVLVSWLDIRPYGILLLTALAVWIVSACCGGVRFENAKPLQEKIRTNLESFSKLRREKPAVFCLIVSMTLFLLMILGHILSGTWLVIGGLTFVGLISSRHNIRIVRVNNDPKPAGGSWTPLSGGESKPIVGEETVVASSKTIEDEFLPEVDETAMNILNRASNDAVLLSTKSSPEDEDKSDSDLIPVDLLIPEDKFPGIDEDSEDEFKPKVKKMMSSQFFVTASDEDTNDEEDSLFSGLNFHGYNVVDHQASQAAAVSSSDNLRVSQQRSDAHHLTSLMSNVLAVGNLIASNVVGAATKPRAPERRLSVDSSSGDDSYEILNKDELDHMTT